MIYSIVPDNVIFFDNEQLRQRSFKIYDNITFELDDGRIERIISTCPEDYIKYAHLLGKNIEE